MKTACFREERATPTKAILSSVEFTLLPGGVVQVVARQGVKKEGRERWKNDMVDLSMSVEQFAELSDQLRRLSEEAVDKEGAPVRPEHLRNRRIRLEYLDYLYNDARAMQNGAAVAYLRSMGARRPGERDDV